METKDLMHEKHVAKLKNDLYLVTKLLHASAVTASMHGKTPYAYTCSFG
jgi:hypothetical protein